MTNAGFKVALPGQNVHTASPKELAVFSGKSLANVPVGDNPLKFGRITHTVAVSPSMSQTVKTIAHGLGYVPMVIIHGHHLSTGKFGPLPLFPLGGDPPPMNWDYTVDRDNITISFSASPTAPTESHTIELTYYIFANEMPTDG